MVFTRQDDRWGHRIDWCTDEGRFVTLLESVEGPPAEGFLPSPPMQDLQTQQSSGGVEVALGLGMGGRNHWSIAFTPASGADHRPGDWLTFGLACRLREYVPELRSSYRVVPPLRLIRVEPHTIEGAGAGVQLRVHSREQLVATDGGFAILGSTRESQPTPYTQNWSYEIGCEPRN